MRVGWTIQSHEIDLCRGDLSQQRFQFLLDPQEIVGSGQPIKIGNRLCGFGNSTVFGCRRRHVVVVAAIVVVVVIAIVVVVVVDHQGLLVVGQELFLQIQILFKVVQHQG